MLVHVAYSQLHPILIHWRFLLWLHCGYAKPLCALGNLRLNLLAYLATLLYKVTLPLLQPLRSNGGMAAGRSNATIALYALRTGRSTEEG